MHEPTSPGAVFVFSGQGSQWPGMGAALLDQEPIFAQTIEACAAELSRLADWSLVDELRADASHSHLNQTGYAQPELVALEIALAALWRSWGIEPAAVVGHSVGEIAAAHVAGALSLGDAMLLAYHRGRLMQRLHGRGGMTAVNLAPEELADVLGAVSDDVCVAAINAPGSVVIAGSTDALHRAMTKLEQRNIACQPLHVDYAFHSPQVDPLHDELVECLARLRPLPATVALYSTVTGQPQDGAACDGQYWARNMRQPVRFADAIGQLASRGFSRFVEVGPHPVLVPSVRRCLAELGPSAVVVPSFHRGSAERRALLTSLAELYSAQMAVHWSTVCGSSGTPRQVVQLPTYPFQGQRYWFTDAPELRSAAPRPRPTKRNTSHALLGPPRSQPRGDVVFDMQLDDGVPWLHDHRVFDVTVFPAAALMEAAWSAGSTALHGSLSGLHDFLIHRPLLVPEGVSVTVQVVVSPMPDQRQAEVAIFSQALATDQHLGVDQAEWTLHCSGRLDVSDATSEAITDTASGQALAEVKRRCFEVVGADLHYWLLREFGLDYGPTFQSVRRIWRRDHEALGELVLPAVLQPDTAGYGIHPALLDACLQTVQAAVEAPTPPTAQDMVFLPLSVDRIHIGRQPTGRVLSHVSVRSSASSDMATEMLVADIDVTDAMDQLCVKLEGLHLKRARRSTLLGGTSGQLSAPLYQVAWEPAAPLAVGEESLTAAPSWIFADQTGVAAMLAERLRDAGETPILISRADVHVQKRADFDRLLTDLDALGRPPRRIVFSWALDLGDGADGADMLGQQQEVLGGLLHLIQSCAALNWPTPPELVIVTRGAQRAGPEAIQASVWGFSRAVMVEEPGVRLRLIDLDPLCGLPTQLGIFLRELSASDGEDEVALHDNERRVARLVAVPAPETDALASQLSSESSYLITGGLGGLGLAVARRLVERGARSLILLGRSAPSSAARKVIADLEAQQAAVHVFACDVSERSQLHDVFTQLDDRGVPPLRGIIHSAGVLDDGIVLQQSWERLGAVLAPKIAGAWNLHLLTRERDLDFFVLFSSGAAVMGAPGQTNYAAANAFLDGLSHARRAAGLPSLSINWGAWADIGMAQASAAIDRKLARDGMRKLEVREGLDLLERLLVSDQSQVAVLPADWSRVGTRASGRSPRLLDHLTPNHRTGQTVATRPPPGHLAQALTGLAGSSATTVLTEFVEATVRRTLGLSPGDALQPEHNLFQLGLDSLMAVELRSELQFALGLSLPTTLVFDRPTVGLLTTFLVSITVVDRD